MMLSWSSEISYSVSTARTNSGKTRFPSTMTSFTRPGLHVYAIARLRTDYDLRNAQDAMIVSALPDPTPSLRRNTDHLEYGVQLTLGFSVLSGWNEFEVRSIVRMGCTARAAPTTH